MSSVDLLLDRQHETFRLISRTIINFKKIGSDNITLAHVETRLSALESNWKKFQEAHEKLVQVKVSLKGESLKDNDYFKKDLVGDCEEAFLQAKCEILEFRNKLTALNPNISVLDQSVAGHATSSSRRLPKINLPRFSGKFTDWAQFRDLFMYMVSSNSEITSVEKLHYLKSSVSNEPAQLIKNISITSESFSRAWETLVSRYENQRLLVDSHLATLFNVSRVTKESSSELKRLLGDTKEALGALEALGSPIKHWDHILVFMLVRKLDPESLKEWEKGIGGKSEPSSFNDLEVFMIGRIHTLEALEQASGQFSKSKQQSSASRVTTALSHGATTRPYNCTLCRENHYLASCPAFKAKSIEQRKEFTTAKNLCYNCLGMHRIRDCRTVKRCQICGNQHHTLLHIIKRRNNADSSRNIPNTSSAVKGTTAQISTHTAQPENISRSSVLLATVQVTVSNPLSGESVRARALLDQGSESSFVTENLAQQLHLPRRHATVPVIGIGAQQSSVTRGIASLQINSQFDRSFQCQFDAFVLPRLTSFLPSFRILTHDWPHLAGLYLGDPDFTQPDKIDIILGADIYSNILLNELRKGAPGTPIAQKSKLGWILSGSVPLEATAATHHASIQSFQCSLDQELHELIQRFWVQEETVQPARLSEEDEKCEQHFVNTFSRTNEGRYIVRLPIKSSSVELGDSRSPALRMLSRMEQRFEHDKELKKTYHNFLTEYKALGHMELAESSCKNSKVFFLPHHGVIRNESSTTKLRVVFNGSQKTNLNLSLNDNLLKGAKLQTELTDVLTRWRCYPFVFTADIGKMYRQILVHEDDRNLQRILWRADLNQPIREYQLNTVTYGLTSAPFLVIRVLHQLVSDEGEKFPLASQIVLREMYVDDVLSGAENIHQTQEKIRQLRGLLSCGGFPLKKWTTNEPVILTDIPPEEKEPVKSFCTSKTQYFRTLGLIWTPNDDCFTFIPPNFTNTLDFTKRNVLSHIAKLFDPLGWLAPVVVKPKLFMQELWCLKVGWDEPLIEPFVHRWKKFIDDLVDLSQIRIPRWIGVTASSSVCEIHGFADASQSALACVVYLRVLTDLNDARVSLVCAKTKVAPLKKVTIPRLELCSALLLVRLVRTILPTLAIPNPPVHLWTDSTVALTWIRGHPSRWKDFVRNRVTEIQDLTSSRWHHVPGSENPADIASRGCTPMQLQGSDSWKCGPSWLAKHSTSWPPSPPALEGNADLEERRTVNVNHAVSNDDKIWDLVGRYSRLTKLLKITALCKRAVQRFSSRPKEATLNKIISPQELEDSLLYWTATVQEAHFAEANHQLKKHGKLLRNHSLNRLAPFLDANGRLRVGGRLHHAPIPYDERHPLILPRESAFTTLIIDYNHRLTLHGGTQLTLATIRRRFWIVGGRVPIRSFIHRCVICTRQRAIISSQQMGQLPITRVTRSRPFLHSGVDYAGPFSVRTSRTRKAQTLKGYIVIFVCFSTSAVHLELVSDYTTEAFIAAYKRFTSRRGICATVTSDCGRNLIGADSELSRLLSESSKESMDIAMRLATLGTKWKFNPPSAPHFGGKWEAGVKSVKFHLKRVVGNLLLTFEEFNTFLTQVEATLNSRPLCAVTDHPSDLNILTPGHFLIESALNIVPEPSLAEVTTSRLSRWQQLRQLLDHFWKRWSTEYLQSLQSLTKWQQIQENLRKGSIVLIKHENLPPSLWPLGRILEVHRGADNLIRVALVKTQTTTLKRPIAKLCLLPVATE